jgi:hypothetical protein
MIRLRFSTCWRLILFAGLVGMPVCIGMMVFKDVFPDEHWLLVCKILAWSVVGGILVFCFVLGLLQRAGLFEYTYTEAERRTRFYRENEEFRQRNEIRLARKRELKRE